MILMTLLSLLLDIACFYIIIEFVIEKHKTADFKKVGDIVIETICLVIFTVLTIFTYFDVLRAIDFFSGK